VHHLCIHACVFHVQTCIGLLTAVHTIREVLPTIPPR
jgi:hypothetical protein